MKRIGHFCLVSELRGFKNRAALRKSLADLTYRMNTEIDPDAEYSWVEEKHLFWSKFFIRGANCLEKHANFFIEVITPRIPEFYNA